VLNVPQSKKNCLREKNRSKKIYWNNYNFHFGNFYIGTYVLFLRFQIYTVDLRGQVIQELQLKSKCDFSTFWLWGLQIAFFSTWKSSFVSIYNCKNIFVDFLSSIVYNKFCMTFLTFWCSMFLCVSAYFFRQVFVHENIYETK
jgi:hypothetical protein